MKINFEFFSDSEMNVTNSQSRKVDEKNRIILQFCSDLDKKSKSIKEIYIYASEKSRYTLSENGIDYYTMTYCFRDIRV